MGRLKGLDEMPEKTGLEIEWPSSYGNEDDEEPGSPFASVRMKIASIMLALIITALGVYIIGMGMLPTKAQIQSEEQRRQLALGNAREQGDTLDAATRPGIYAVDGSMTGERGSVDSSGVHVGVAFPDGTIEWGEEGQPIGGELERIEIWDVTGSSENKVIRVRSGPEIIFATIYLRSGQRTRIMVPTGSAYQVMATSGTDWHGPVERFGPTATTVNFGIVTIYAGRPGVVAMGAPDQTANIVGNDRF